MYKTIVVGVDGRTGDSDAITLARELGGPDATIVLASVVENQERVGDDVTPYFDRMIRDHLEANVAALSARMTGGAAVTEVVTETWVSRGLVGVAERHHADLVVLASCRSAGPGQAATGEDAKATVRAADCPVAVAPHGYAQHRGPVAAAASGSAFIQQPTAQRVADELGAR